MGSVTTGPAAAKVAAGAAPARSHYRRRWRYLLFAAPALLVIFAVILFPWGFTIFLSTHDWPIVGERTFVGLGNYKQLLHDTRFLESIARTFYFTFLAVLLPVVLGIGAAVVFHREFPFRGVLRTLFMMPMMATPVAIALVWTMMFHPQLGVLNYLLSLVGIPPSSGCSRPAPSSRASC